MVFVGLSSANIFSLELVSFPIAYLLKSLPQETEIVKEAQLSASRESSSTTQPTFEDGILNYDSQIIFELSKKVLNHLKSKLFAEESFSKGKPFCSENIAQLIIPQFKLGTFSSLIQIVDEIQKTKLKISTLVQKILEDSSKLFCSGNEPTIDECELQNLVNETIRGLSINPSWNFTRFKSDGRLNAVLGDIQMEYEKLQNSYVKKKNDYCQSLTGERGSRKQFLDHLCTEDLMALQSRLKELPGVQDVLNSELLKFVSVWIDRSFEEEFTKTYPRLIENCVPDSMLFLLRTADGHCVYGVFVMQPGGDGAVLIPKAPQKCVAESVSANFLSQLRQKISHSHQTASSLAVLRNIWEITLRETLVVLFHAHLLELYCESALVFGLPTLYVFLVYTGDPKAPADQKQLFFKKLDETLEEDFLCPHQTLPAGDKSCFLNVSFPSPTSAANLR